MAEVESSLFNSTVSAFVSLTVLNCFNWVAVAIAFTVGGIVLLFQFYCFLEGAVSQSRETL